MEESKKSLRYERIYAQLTELLRRSEEPLARMSTVVAVLHHKFNQYFWTGFYLLKKEELIVGPYQGPVACMVLKKNSGVCWSAVKNQRTEIVPDVEKFPGHIACDSRSRSEIVVPVRNNRGKITAVLDVDSRELAAFDKVDALYLSKIVKLIYG